MKRLLQAGIILAGFASMPSWGVLITSTDPYINVGSVDLLEGQIDNDGLALICTGGSPDCETEWVNSILEGPDVSWTVKNEDIDYFATNTDDVYAFELTGEPEYFLIKNSTHRALFQNLINVNWGVFDVVLLGGEDGGFNLGGVSDDLIISHVMQLGDSASVPEPGMVGLLAIGLLGVAVARRKKTA